MRAKEPDCGWMLVTITIRLYVLSLASFLKRERDKLFFAFELRRRRGHSNNVSLREGASERMKESSGLSPRLSLFFPSKFRAFIGFLVALSSIIGQRLIRKEEYYKQIADHKLVMHLHRKCTLFSPGNVTNFRSCKYFAFLVRLNAIRLSSSSTSHSSFDESMVFAIVFSQKWAYY